MEAGGPGLPDGREPGVVGGPEVVGLPTRDGCQSRHDFCDAVPFDQGGEGFFQGCHSNPLPASRSQAQRCLHPLPSVPMPQRLKPLQSQLLSSPSSKTLYQPRSPSSISPCLTTSNARCP